MNEHSDISSPLIFELTGKPVAQSRARLGRRGIYDPTSAKKIAVKRILIQQMAKNRVYLSSNQKIKVELIFYTPIPKSLSKRKKIALEDQWDVKKPDIDNYIKFYLDAFNGIVYEDDKSIVSIYAEKRKSENPRVNILIKTL